MSNDLFSCEPPGRSRSSLKTVVCFGEAGELRKKDGSVGAPRPDAPHAGGLSCEAWTRHISADSAPTCLEHTEDPHNSPDSSRLCSDTSGTRERSREIEHVEMPRIPGFWGIACHA